MNEVLFSTDVESDGPIPGIYSMLSFASVAYTEDGEQLGNFSANLETLPLADEHPETMAFWAKNPEAYAATRKNLAAPAEVMQVFSSWVSAWSGLGKPVFLGYPATFDFLHLYWYLIKFTGKSPFSFSALDIKSYAMAVLGSRFRETTKSKMPRALLEGLPPHTHCALDDAKEQGELFFRLKALNSSRVYER